MSAYIASGLHGQVSRSEYEGNKCAIKKFASDDTDIYEKEKEILIQLQNQQGIPKLYTSYDKANALVMELALCNMSEWINDLPQLVSVDLWLDMTIQILQAIQSLHEKGLVHRDIKPQNILVACGKPMRIVLCDFSLVEKNDDRAITAGTRGYLHPDLTMGCMETVCYWQDIYAVSLFFEKFALVIDNNTDESITRKIMRHIQKMRLTKKLGASYFIDIFLKLKQKINEFTPQKDDAYWTNKKGKMSAILERIMDKLLDLCRSRSELGDISKGMDAIMEFNEFKTQRQAEHWIIKNNESKLFSIVSSEIESLWIEFQSQFKSV